MGGVLGGAIGDEAFISLTEMVASTSQPARNSSIGLVKINSGCRLAS